MRNSAMTTGLLCDVGAERYPLIVQKDRPFFLASFCNVGYCFWPVFAS